MKRILVPCDFSEPAQAAYRSALEVAQVSHGEIFILHAIDLPVIYASGFDIQPYAYDPTLLRELEEQSKRSYEELIKKYSSKFVPVSFTVLQGAVTPVIRNFIKEKKIDLVVMGTSGASGFQEFFIGSNTEKIVRLAQAPVIAIRKPLTFSSIKKIVFPSTLQLDQSELIHKITELQNFFGATLHLLWVNTPPHFKSDYEVRGMLKDYVEHFKLKNYTLNIRSDSYEQDGIIKFAQEINADMIAMATHGRRGLAHLISGSISEEVVNHVNCPIWTYVTR